MKAEMTGLMNPAALELRNRLLARPERQASAASSAASEAREAELRKASEEFESIFISLVLRELKKTLKNGTLLPPGPGSNIHESMLTEMLAQELARKGGTGLSEAIYTALRENEKPSSGKENPLSQGKETAKTAKDISAKAYIDRVCLESLHKKEIQASGQEVFSIDLLK